MGQPESAVCGSQKQGEGMFLVWSFWSIPSLAGGWSLDASFWADVHVNIVSNYGVPTLSTRRMRLYQTDHSYRQFRARRRRCTVLPIRRDDTHYHTRLVDICVRLVNLYSTSSPFIGCLGSDAFFCRIQYIIYNPPLSKRSLHLFLSWISCSTPSRA